MTETCKEFDNLVHIVKTLRGEHGCEWDKAQTHESLTPYLLEETYEVLEAIQENKPEKLKEELGDLLLHIVFQAEIGEEEQRFNLNDSIRTINEKLVRRHPHVFNGVQANLKEIKQNWEEIKLKEGRKSLMEGLPKTIPALLQARRVQERAAQVGFDWDDISGVWAKIKEELHELDEAVESGNREHIVEEFGDMLFAIVNLSRFLNLDPEAALRKNVKKFVARFQKVEDDFASRGVSMKNATLADMDQVWNDVKRTENHCQPDSLSRTETE